jgi:hypothetical protein
MKLMKVSKVNYIHLLINVLLNNSNCILHRDDIYILTIHSSI